jgi:hypothetical protein
MAPALSFATDYSGPEAVDPKAHSSQIRGGPRDCLGRGGGGRP